MPSASRASLRPISCVAIDLTLTTSRSPVSLTSRATIALASSASAAQCTVPPAAVTASSTWTRYRSRWRRVWSLMRRPASRSAAQSSSSATARARLSRMVCVAWRRLPRRVGLRTAVRAASGKAGIPTNVPLIR